MHIDNPLGGYDTVLLQSGLMYRDNFGDPEEFHGGKNKDEWKNRNRMVTGFMGVYGRGNEPGDPIDPVYKKDGSTPTYKAGPTTPHGVMPIPGVKTISVSYTGEMKASKEATIEWVCWSFRDLERLTPHFLEMGKLVTLEWGWGGLGGDTPIPLDYDTIINATNQAEGRTNRISLHDEIQHIVFENGGNYDAMVGVISNFEWNLRSDGGFDCTTKLKSRGVNIINQALGSPSNIRGVKLKTAEDEEDNISTQLTFDKFMDQMVSYIKELTSTMQFESQHLKTYWDTIKGNQKISYSKEGFIISIINK